MNATNKLLSRYSQAAFITSSIWSLKVMMMITKIPYSCDQQIIVNSNQTKISKKQLSKPDLT